jgi:hypothetical protein
LRPNLAPPQAGDFLPAQPGHDQQAEDGAIGRVDFAGGVPHDAKLVVVEDSLARLEIGRAAEKEGALHPGER